MTYPRWLTLTAALTITFTGLVLALMYRTVVAPGYYSLIADPFQRNQDHAFGLRNTDCQVLIYGDSTGMTGYDPRILEQELGLSSCNISRTMSVLTGNGTLALDQYLGNNHKPRYIVMQMAPETFYRDRRWSHLRDLNLIAELLRHQPGIATSWQLLIHPQQTATFSANALRSRLFPGGAKKLLFEGEYAPVFEEFHRSKGLLTIPQPAETHCTEIPRGLEAPVDTGWIQEVHRKYAAQGITALMNVSPIPECDPRIALYQRTLAPQLDNQLEIYPIGLFNDLDRHFTTEGAARATRALAQQIRSLENKRR